jgi:hypothetical protein
MVSVKFWVIGVDRVLGFQHQVVDAAGAGIGRTGQLAVTGSRLNPTGSPADRRSGRDDRRR